MSDNVLDLTEKLKKKLEKNDEGYEYYTRYHECYKNTITNGSCDCKICLTKIEMADKLIVEASRLAVEYMKNSNENLYYADVLECFIIAGLKLKEFCLGEQK